MFSGRSQIRYFIKTSLIICGNAIYLVVVFSLIGSGKGVLLESVRGTDLYIMVDVCNYSLTYSLSGHTNRMSPDDHFQNLKRKMLRGLDIGAFLL